MLLAPEKTISGRTVRLGSDLTPRERQVLALLADGKAQKLVAYELGISERTVEVFVAKIKQRLGASNLIEIGKFAICYSIIANDIVKPVSQYCE